MSISIQEICRGKAFTAFFDEATIEKCHYINAQEERVEEILTLEGVMMQGGMNGSYTIHISGYNPLTHHNAPLVRFSVRQFSYDKQRTAEMAIATNNLRKIEPITLGVLENSNPTYFSIIKDGDKQYSWLMLNPPHSDDYYYRIMFK